MTIRRRKNRTGKSRYQAEVKVNGQRLFKSFETRVSADRWVNELRFKRDRKLEITSGPVSIGQLFEAYLKDAEAKGRSLGTLKSAQERYRVHIEPFFAGIDMKGVEVGEYEDLLQTLSGKGLKASTRNRVRSLLRVMLTNAIRKRLFNGAFEINPFDAIDPACEDKPKIQYWNKDELNRFLSFLEGQHYYPFFLTMLKTGLRIGEALAIHSEQIDQSIGLLTVDRQFIEAANQVRFQTKGRRIRHVALIPEVTEALYPILKEGLVFQKPDGSPLTPNYVRKFVLPRLCKQAGVKDIGPHGLRHTFSAHYLMEGGTLWDLAKILDHSTTRVTEERYGHFDLEHVRRRMNVVTRQGNVIQAEFGQGYGKGYGEK